MYVRMFNSKMHSKALTSVGAVVVDTFQSPTTLRQIAPPRSRTKESVPESKQMPTKDALLRGSLGLGFGA